MALPVPEWIVDFATARHVLAGNDNVLKNAFNQMCQAGTLRYCACEHKSFSGDAEVANCFCRQGQCRCDVDGATQGIAGAMPNVIGRKRMHPNDPSAKIIAACAVQFNLGVISNKVGIYLSAVDLAQHAGLNWLTLTDFRAAL